MKLPVICAIFSATLVASNCLAQQETAPDSAGQQTGQATESVTNNAATNASESVIDEAPSGNEQAVKSIDPDSGASVTIPGKDAPVSETTQGNQTTLDFDVSDPSKASEKNTTIMIERQPPQDAQATPEATQGEPDQADRPGTGSDQPDPPAEP